MLRGWGLVLQVERGGHGIGVLGILVVLAGLYLVLDALWRRDKQRKAARDRALADRLLERIYQQPDEPINLTRLARQMHLRPSVVKDLCEGKLIKEGYLHHKRRPRKDRVDKLFLSPSGREAMERRKQPKP
jgi:DNA-binding MarR family transcriptional regulator